MGKKYFMKVAVDFGSTNTVMTWRMYEHTDDGQLIVSQKYNSDNPIIKIPSVMILVEENPGNEEVKKDLFGEEAVESIKNSNIPPVVRDNFKQYLYVYSPEKDKREYEKGKELCTKFFEHLRSVYRQKIINLLPSYILSDMEVALFLSTPVRAHPTHRSEMRKIALDAGFTSDNLVTEINTDLDEATCVVRYAIANRKDAMKEIFAKSGSEKGALLLFADAGGSTFDMCIKRLHILNDGTMHMDPVSEWPSPNVKYPLGGCLIDEAIRDYLITEGYADKEFTLDNWENGDGKFSFRVFKENINKQVETGVIEDLGKLEDACCAYRKGITPPKKYYMSPTKINAKIYEEQICAEYIRKFKEALKEIFAEQRKTEFGDVEPADIDGIFLFGAGSKLYFIPRLLCEDFDDKTPGFVKIQKNNSLLFTGWDDPSTCCVLGALTEDKNIKMPSYSKGKYFVSFQIFNHDSMTKQDLVHMIGSSEHERRCIANDIVQITEKHQLLPHTSSYKKIIEYDDTLIENRYITMQIVLMQLKENGEYKTVSNPCLLTTSKKLSKEIREYAGLGGAVLGSPTIFVVGILDWVSKKFGSKRDLMDDYIEVLGAMCFPDNERKLNLNICFTMTEHHDLLVDTKIESKNFKTSEKSYSFKI